MHRDTRKDAVPGLHSNLPFEVAATETDGRRAKTKVDDNVTYVDGELLHRAREVETLAESSRPSLQRRRQRKRRWENRDVR